MVCTKVQWPAKLQNMFVTSRYGDVIGDATAICSNLDDGEKIYTAVQ